MNADRNNPEVNQQWMDSHKLKQCGMYSIVFLSYYSTTKRNELLTQITIQMTMKIC